jgi:hypothetical protein
MDYIGNIQVPEIGVAGVFPMTPDCGYGRAQEPQVVVHQFGSGNAKIEQRFYLGAGARRFTVRKAFLGPTDLAALRAFCEARGGAYGSFTYNEPAHDGLGTTARTVRLADEPLSWGMVADAVASVGVTLIEAPATTADYPLNQALTRFPSAALADALLWQVQEIVPLIAIKPKTMVWAPTGEGPAPVPTPGTSRPWSTDGGLNPGYPYLNDASGTDPVVTATGLAVGQRITVLAYGSETAAGTLFEEDGGLHPAVTEVRLIWESAASSGSVQRSGPGQGPRYEVVEWKRTG